MPKLRPTTDSTAPASAASAALPIVPAGYELSAKDQAIFRLKSGRGAEKRLAHVPSHVLHYWRLRLGLNFGGPNGNLVTLDEVHKAIARVQAGESPAAVAASMNLEPTTIRNYTGASHAYVRAAVFAQARKRYLNGATMAKVLAYLNARTRTPLTEKEFKARLSGEDLAARAKKVRKEQKAEAPEAGTVADQQDTAFAAGMKAAFQAEKAIDQSRRGKPAARAQAAETRWGVSYPSGSRITVDPAVMNGVPCIRGMRIPVATVLGMLDEGMTPADVIASYRVLTRADIDAALEFRKTANAQKAADPAPAQPPADWRAPCAGNSSNEAADAALNLILRGEEILKQLRSLDVWTTATVARLDQLLEASAADAKNTANLAADLGTRLLQVEEKVTALARIWE